MKTVASLIASSTIGIAATGLTVEKIQPTSSENKENIDSSYHFREFLHSPSPQRPTSVSSFWNGVFDHDFSQIFPQEIQSAISPKFRRRPPLTHERKAGHTRSSKRPLSTCNTDQCFANKLHTDEEKKRNSVSSRGSLMRCLSTISSYRCSRENTISDQQTSQEALFGFWHPSPPSSNESPKILARNRLVKLDPNSKECRNRTVKLNTQTKEYRSKTMRMDPQMREPPGESIDHTCSRPKSYIFRRSPTCHHYTYFSSRFLQKQKEDANEATFISIPRNENSRHSNRIWNLYLDPRRSKNYRKPNSRLEFDGENQSRTALCCYYISSKRGSIKKTPVNTAVVDLNDQRLSQDESNMYEIDVNIPGQKRESSEKSFILVSPESNIETVKCLHRSISLKLNSSIAEFKKIRSIRQGAKEWTRNHSAPVLLLANSQPLGGFYEREMRDNYCTPLNDPFTFMRKSSVMMLEDQDPHEKSPEGSLLHHSNSPSHEFSSRASSMSKEPLCAELNSSSSASQDQPHLSSLSISQTQLTTTVYDYYSSGGKNCSIDMPYFPLINARTNYCPFEIADRASTLIGSDFDAKWFTSGDEDNVDFQSDTVFDSWRSGTTGTTNVSKPPLEYMFIDSFPNVEDNPSNSKLYNHIITNHDGAFPDIASQILEQDKSALSLLDYDRSLPSAKKDVSPTTCQNEVLCLEAFALPTSSLCSLKSNDYDNDNNDDDNEHENWTMDHNHPDSTTQICYSFNLPCVTQNMNHSVEPVLSTDGHGDDRRYLYPSYKPKTNVFDWSEPSSLERLDSVGNPLRPKTAHVKDSPDNRTGRGLGRRYPCTFHIRSQSVPISPDMNACKIVSKFGTWGLGSTTISEDWDGDFDFENIDSKNLSGEATLEGNHGMLVPEAIQASQENVTGHVGQIREVCLLVDDLKKLRLLGKEQGLLDGEFKPLWLQAEGIIALAAPMDDVDDLEDHVVQKKKNECSSKICTSLSSLISNKPPQLSCEDYDLNSDSSFFHNNLNSERCETTDPKEHTDIPHANANSTAVLDSVSLDRSNPVSGHSTQNSTEVARKLMESIHQQRTSSDPLSHSFTENPTTKMPFDTTSLKDLVNRASALSRALGQIVHVPDVSFLSSATRIRESSPAFTQVFLEPSVIPPNSSPRSERYSTTTNDTNKNSPFQSSSQQVLMTAVI